MRPLLAEYKQGRNMIFDISAHPALPIEDFVADILLVQLDI